MVGEPAVIAEDEMTLATSAHVAIVVHNGPIVTFRSGTVLDVLHSVQRDFQQNFVEFLEQLTVDQISNLKIISGKFDKKC